MLSLYAILKCLNTVFIYNKIREGKEINSNSNLAFS